MQKHSLKSRVVSIALATIMTVTMFSTSIFTVFAGESLPMTGEAARKQNQPKFSGYRILDIKDWSPETDPYAEYLVSKVPLQNRNEAFKATQANPTLESDAEIMLMQGDYGNVFTDPMMYNNTFGQLTLNFWQYADYFSPWHGSTTSSTPESLYDWQMELTDSNSWQKRYFEFGVLNIPNPSYTNAAHRNGVKSIACIYFDQSFRAGQTINELFVQDEDGTFPVAEKLIEMAKYFGYDGYFFNAEESVSPKYAAAKRQFLARLTESGLYTQYYDTNSTMNDSKASWLNYDINDDGKKEKVQDSVFINYGSRSQSGMDAQIQFMNDNNINPFKQAFYGVESNQNGFSGGHNSATTIPGMYTAGTKNLRASLALFTPSDYYQRGLPDDLKKKADVIQDPDYQWMIAERERMYFSGVKCDPTDTGAQAGYSRPDVGVKNASGWVGAADFTSERSVINGTVFHTNFNVGKGMQYFTNGKVSRDEQWTNITVQDILPTWQWWVESTGNKLKLDFDYGEKYYTGATQFTHVGAYNGGSSLVVVGDLQQAAKNTVHLYKTDLNVKSGSTVDITYNKPSASDGTEMSLVVYLKDDPTNPVYLPISGTGTKTTGWTTKTVDLGAYAGKDIAAFGLGFEAKQADASGYQINIGEIRVKDGTDHTPAQPTGLKFDKIYSTDEYALKWDLGDFDKIDRYDIYATLSNGEKINIGSTYDSIYYVKSLMNEKNYVNVELVAVGKDGSQSTAATCKLDYTNKVSNLKAETAMNSTNLIEQNKTAGVIELSWTNPTTDYKAIEISANLINSKDDYVSKTTVGKGVTSVVLPFDRTNGEDYEVYATTVFNDGSKSEAVRISGKTKDNYSMPYDEEKILIDSNGYLTLWQPTSSDWHYMYVKCNGQNVSFSSRFVGTKDYVWRATTYMGAYLPATSGTLEITLEDYSGNISEPLYYNFTTDPEAVVDDTMIPDETLRNAIIAAVGSDKVQDVIAYEGDLDLSNLEIADYTGLELVSGAKTVNLSGATFETLEGITFPGKVEKIVLDNCTNLKKIDHFALSGYKKLNELSVKGCTGLVEMYLESTTLEKLDVSDLGDYANLFSLDMSNAKFDMTEGTPERNFVDAIAAQNEGKEDIVNKDVTASNLIAKANNTGDPIAEEFYNGDLNDYASLGGNVTYVFGFTCPQQFTTFRILSYSNYFKPDGYKLSASDDGVNFTSIVEKTSDNMSGDEIYTFDENFKAKFVKVELQASYSFIKEIQLNGYFEQIVSSGAKYDNQRPNIYYSYPAEVNVKVSDTNARAVAELDPTTLVKAQTVRGTMLDELKEATFLAEDYDVNAKALPDNVYARVYDADNNVSFMVPTDKEAKYDVKFVRVDASAPQGAVDGETIVNVVSDNLPTPGPGTASNTSSWAYAVAIALASLSLAVLVIYSKNKSRE